MAWLRAPIALFLVALVAIGGVAVAAIAMRRVIRMSDVALAQAAIDLGETERLRSLWERVSRKARTFLFTSEESAPARKPPKRPPKPWWWYGSLPVSQCSSLPFRRLRSHEL